MSTDTINTVTTTQHVLAEVHDERSRQDIKWGVPNHPDGTSRAYEGDANFQKRKVDHETRMGRLTFADILLEEVFEALSETDPAALREELVQVAAVAVKWVEAIDRRA